MGGSVGYIQPEWLLPSKPRPVQVEALRRAFPPQGPRRGWLHFMEMRLGKTFTAINEFLLLRKHGHSKRWVIFAPNSLKEDWFKTLRSLQNVHKLPVSLYESSKRKAFLKTVESEGIYIFNYEAVTYKAGAKVLDGLCDPDTLLTADETIWLQGLGSAASNIRDAADKCGFVRGLTGNPTPKDVTQLWGQLRLTRAYTPSFYAFRANFAHMGGFKVRGKGTKVIGIKNKVALDKLLEASAFTATRADWSRPTEIDRQVIQVPLPKALQELYDQMQRYSAIEFEGVDIIGVHAAARAQKMQQIGSGFIYDDDGSCVRLSALNATPKYKRLIELLDYLSGPVVVYAHFVPTMNGLYDQLTSDGYEVALMGSKRLMKERGLDLETEKALFNNGEAPILLAQAHAVREGHAFVGTPDNPCRSVVYFENSYNSNTRIQSEQRPQSVDGGALYIADITSTKTESRIVQILAHGRSIWPTLQEMFTKEKDTECAT